MPPHLHPRSRMTTSLFTTTLMVSFLVVAAPHLIPCPVDPRTMADSADPTGEKRRRRRRILADLEDETGDQAARDARLRQLQLQDKLNPKRECPVPKPGGLIGQVLGVRKEQDEDQHVSNVRSRVERARKETQSKDDQ